MDTEGKKVLVWGSSLVSNLKKVGRMRSVDYLWMHLLPQTKTKNELHLTH